MKKRFVLSLLMFLSLVVSVSALPLFPIPNQGSTPNTSFEYEFNFTAYEDCSGVLLTNKSNLTTNSAGYAFIDINIDGLDELTVTPSFLCEYRDGSLRKVHTASSSWFNNSWFKGDVSIDETLKGGTPLQIEENIEYVNETGDTVHEVYLGKFGEAYSHVPEAFDNSLIYDTHSVANQYNMEIVFFDGFYNRSIFVLNEGIKGRATTVRRSFQIINNVTVKPDNENVTLCEGFSYIDCDTDGTGADLGVSDDIEAVGSVYVGENLYAEGNIDSPSGLGVPIINAINISCDKISSDLINVQELHTTNLYSDSINTDRITATNVSSSLIEVEDLVVDDLIKMSIPSGCLMLRDTDDGGWTKCTALNDVLSCVVDADGNC